ncbi:DoxX family protein [Ascidiimonas sp. W6]|uniref:DoxX family protein n=1 Tax=Ascidiimonas meishanensis TaxID=3128903 RepID=UPI0030EE9EB8
MKVALIATFISGISFLIYGFTCILTKHMKDEFIRFKIPQWRITTGILQLIGGLGLLAGFWFSPVLAAVSAAGLCLLMILGFGVRIKIKDTVLASSPAFFYAALNLYLFIYYFKLFLLAN